MVAGEQRTRDPLERVLLRVGSSTARRESGLRHGHVRELGAALEGEHASVAVELNDLAGDLPGRGIKRTLTKPELVLLRGIGEPVGMSARFGGFGLPQESSIPIESESSTSSSAVFPSGRRRPPDRLALPVVVLEQTRAIERPLAVVEELAGERRTFSFTVRPVWAHSAQRAGTRRIAGSPPPPLQQPVAQQQGGDAVLLLYSAIASRSAWSRVWIYRSNSTIDVAAVLNLRVALELQERLHLLQPVAAADAASPPLARPCSRSTRTPRRSRSSISSSRVP